MAVIFYSAMEINFDFACSIVILFIWFQIIIKIDCFYSVHNRYRQQRRRRNVLFLDSKSWAFLWKQSVDINPFRLQQQFVMDMLTF